MGNVLKALFTPFGIPKAIGELTTHNKHSAGSTYDENAEKNKAAEQAANANKKRALEETETTMSSALGDVGTKQVQKKTLLGG